MKDPSFTERYRKAAQAVALMGCLALTTVVMRAEDWVVEHDGALRLELSRNWYRSGTFRGTIRPVAATVSVNLYLRYAGTLEFTVVRLDYAAKQAAIVQAHQGQRVVLASASWPELSRSESLEFLIEHGPTGAKIRLQQGTEREFNLGELALPEGRIGMGVEGGIDERHIELEKANTTSAFDRYAFNLNRSMAGRLRQEPFFKYLEHEAEELEKKHPITFRSSTDVKTYRREAVFKLRRSLGLDPWPERNPLNARIVGTVDRRNFQIQRIIFESQPDFLVTALLYLPKKARFPAAAVLSPIGHWEDGFFIWSEQARAIGLAERGYVVLTYDPISQGERKWLGNGSHDTLRRKIILAGMEVSGLMFWDSIRAIDYLSSRPEVDPERIGITGISGGGFNALYTALLDDRVKVVIPAGYNTTLGALIRRGGAGCCAYIPDMISYAGLDISDAYALLAPRPLLMLGGYMDYLSDRIVENAAHCKAVYRLFGMEEQVSYFMDKDAGHTYSKQMRLQMYAWFEKWLKAPEQRVAIEEQLDPEYSLISRESGLLEVRGNGPRGKSVLDLALEFLAKRGERLQPRNDQEFIELRRAWLRSLAAMIPLEGAESIPKVKAQDTSGQQLQVELSTGPELTTSVVILRPLRAQPKQLSVYFHLWGTKPPEVFSGQATVRRLLDEGSVVAIPIVRADGAGIPTGYQSAELYTMALGKHLFSGRVADLAKALSYLRSRPELAALPVQVYSSGIREGAMTLCWMALDKRIEKLTSEGGLVSYSDVFVRDTLPDYDWYVPGMLLHVDLPQVAALVAPRALTIRKPLNSDGVPCSFAEAEQAYAVTKRAYELGRSGSASKFSLEI